MLLTAVESVREAGRIILMHFDRLDRVQVSSKGYNDYVSQADIEAERAIIQILMRRYPDHGLLAEETGSKTGNEFTWIIDPLDGTTNFLHGFPSFAISVAAIRNKTIEHGVIYDPLRDELFMASRGEGAQLNNKRIRVSNTRNLNPSLIGTGFPFKDTSSLKKWTHAFETIAPKTAGIRRAGAATLDLAYVACGRLDGFWEYDLHSWDMAAGALLIREAGGLIASIEGDQDFLDTGNVIAANPLIFEELRKLIFLNSQ